MHIMCQRDPNVDTEDPVSPPLIKTMHTWRETAATANISQSNNFGTPRTLLEDLDIAAETTDSLFAKADIFSAVFQASLYSTKSEVQLLLVHRAGEHFATLCALDAMMKEAALPSLSEIDEYLSGTVSGYGPMDSAEAGLSGGCRNPSNYPQQGLTMSAKGQTILGQQLDYCEFVEQQSKPGSVSAAAAGKAPKPPANASHGQVATWKKGTKAATSRFRGVTRHRCRLHHQ